MKYIGSKNRISKEILPIMLKSRKVGQWWVEPFVGGANMIDKVGGNRLGNDSNKYLIAMLKKLQGGWIPRHDYTKAYYERHKKYKTDKTLNDYEVGFCGIALSFKGKWFGGFVGTEKYYKKTKSVRNFQKEAVANIKKQQRYLKGIKFVSGSYEDLEIPENSIVYCDPPYKGTLAYKDKFNHERFYDWCREKNAEGHTIYVSEYDMPKDFICIWKKNLSVGVSTKQKREATEKLFLLKKDLTELK